MAESTDSSYETVLDLVNFSNHVHQGLKQYIYMFPDIVEIEDNIERLIAEVDKGMYKHCTADRSPLRNKYFFGERYTYGDGLGKEMLFPEGQVDPIPTWITRLIIKPLEEAGVLPPGFINSAVINLNLPGGCIVSHKDPSHIFDRPIVSASFLSDSALSFGCKFKFKPIRVTKPITTVTLPRGSVLSMSGFAADGITHCIRPEDVIARRAAIILRRVRPGAPRMSMERFFILSQINRGFSHDRRIPHKRAREDIEREETYPKRARNENNIGFLHPSSRQN